MFPHGNIVFGNQCLNMNIRDVMKHGEDMNISQKYYGLLFSVIMAGIMSMVMSFAMIAINVGFGPNFLAIWLKDIVIGFIVATPTAMAAVPIARRLVNWLTTPNTVTQAERNR